MTANASPSYLALGGDIRRSREQDDRAALQSRLEAALARANADFAAALAVPLAAVQGDAFQGLLAGPEAVVPLLVALERDLRPATFRAGLGRGALATPLRETTATMDGPAFHRARAALDQAREQDAWLVVRGFDEASTQVIDGLAALLGAVRRDWSPARWRAVDARRGHATAKAAAAEIGISPSAISRALKAAHYTEVLAAESALGELLRRACAEAGA